MKQIYQNEVITVSELPLDKTGFLKDNNIIFKNPEYLSILVNIHEEIDVLDNYLKD